MPEKAEQDVSGANIEMAVADEPKLPRSVRFKALCTLIGGWCALFATFGYANAFGVYQDFYQRSALSTSSDISWIGSLQLFFLVAMGLPAGRLLERGYFKQVVFAGSVLYIISAFMLSLASPHSYYQVILSQGVGMGIGAGLIYMPALTVQAHHWKSHRALAMGTVMTGTSTGSIVFSILLNRLMNGQVGFAWGVRTSAFIILGMLLAANTLMSSGPAHPRDFDDKVALGEVICDRPFILGITGLLLGLMGVYFPYFYLQATEILHGVSKDLAFYTIAILNGVSIPGRIISGILADRFGVLNVITPSCLLGGALTLIMLNVKTAETAIIVSVLFGLSSGAFFALLGPVPATLSRRPSELGLRMALTFGYTSFGTLAGTPIDGALVAGNKWFRPALFSAHWILDQARLWQAFVVHQPDKDGPDLFYALLRDPRNVVRIVFFVSEMIVLDSLLLYRLYVIWNNNWMVIVLPALTEIGTVVTGVALCVGFARAPPYVDLWDLTLANLVNAATMITLLSRHTVHFTILAIASPTTGISFSLITLRVGLGKAFSRFTGGNSAGDPDSIQKNSIPMHVRITREQEFTVTQDDVFGRKNSVQESVLNMTQTDHVKGTTSLLREP
ncbi:MFS general substrate transporter [Punctularia strigosozonata HHB-11173 SS5]|uniref:MFS general substrate transporter n=1 Tax=Punctularia strigosozonata (strain HHB-11173) TaxID=741275 RepID=UPI0004416EBD|nr:MFS general substrate transporter [Punctularia strigosozonata HHB-11173 SS5]EIN05361.1 MFS general substrate transporter [Punctularia strigosozonata HHB-11173 SS5]